MAATNVLRFEVKFCDEDMTWAVVDNHHDSLPFAWFITETTAIRFCEWENNNFYFPF